MKLIFALAAFVLIIVFSSPYVYLMGNHPDEIPYVAMITVPTALYFAFSHVRGSRFWKWFVLGLAGLPLALQGLYNVAKLAGNNALAEQIHGYRYWSIPMALVASFVLLLLFHWGGQIVSLFRRRHH